MAKIMTKKEGRPTKYTENILKLAYKYIEGCNDEIAEILESENEKTGRTRFTQKLVVKLPKAEGLALCLNVSRDTLYEWAKQYPKFSDILERINQIQADRVINEALAGNYNPLIAKLLLGKHGYKDQSDITSGGESLFKPTPEEKARANKALKDLNV